MLTEGERRVPALMLRHTQVNRVVDEMMPRFTESFEEDQFTWAVYMNNATIVKKSSRNSGRVYRGIRDSCSNHCID